MDIVPLRNVALDTWSVFLKTLDITNVGPILHQSVVILSQPHQSYAPAQLDAVCSILRFLLVENESFFSSYFHEFCLLPSIPEFGEMNNIILLRRGNSKDLVWQIKSLLPMVGHENTIVCHQALQELVDLLQSNEAELLELLLVDAINPVFNELIKLLLFTCHKYNGTNVIIQRLVCECLGIIGAVDPARLNADPADNTKILLDNLESKDAAISFVCEFIEKHLVKAFKNARTTKMQTQFSFTIQELLKFCGFTVDIVEAHTVTENALQLKARWRSFPAAVIEAITPLLYSKYSLNAAPAKPAEYPLYDKKSSYREWLQTWVIDSINRVHGAHAQGIFGVCKTIVRGDDINIALFILPHLIMKVLLKGSTDDRDDILSEFLAVLMNADGNATNEKAQLSSQVRAPFKRFFKAELRHSIETLH